MRGPPKFKTLSKELVIKEGTQSAPYPSGTSLVVGGDH